jgi:DNA-directed RNA polymerase specialized sigma24 family protein
LQEIHFAIWRSLPIFDRRCSTRTWIYRVAHNTAYTHIARDRRRARAQDFHRTELVRRRQLLAGSWRLVIGPLLLGLLVFTACLALRDPSNQAAPFVLCAITVMLGVAMAIYKRWQAKRLQHDIDELNALGAIASSEGGIR